MANVTIAFSGIGAVGGFYGGLLAHFYQQSADVDVYFISRGENLSVIRNKGLTIRMQDRMIQATPRGVTDNPQSIGEVDYLFCTTKSYNLEDNIRQLRPVIGNKTIVIPLLNGADISERIQKLLPENIVWEGCVYIGARLTEPGVVEKFSLKDRLFFGGAKLKERQSQLLKLLLDAGVNAFNPEDIDQRIWKKFFMISTAATITSYYNLPIGEVIRQYKDDFIELGNELKHVAEAKGILLPEDIVTSSIEAQAMMPSGATTSMHADFQKGGQTELETLTGYVVNTAGQLGVEVPLYKKMYDHLLTKTN